MTGSQFDLFNRPAPASTEPESTAVPSERTLGLPDRAQRERIVTALEENLLVEAGAGAGKTTEMVFRMAALVSADVRVEQIAAVTFTRKAAAELRERFQTKLEGELREVRGAADAEAVERIDRALRDIDRAFIGTIHSFCARLLRDRPLEAGIDPDFRETFAVEQERLRREFFAGHIERLAASGDASLGELARVGLRPDQLRRLFDELTEHGDVAFPAAQVERPDPSAARATLFQLIDDAHELMPDVEPPGGWDNLQSTIRRLKFYRDVVGLDDDVRFLHVLAETLAAMPRATYNRWSDSRAGNEVVRALVRRFEEYTGPDGAGGRVLRQWWAHRYPIALSFARRAAAAFEEERRRTGALSFQDLLMSTARLLRTSPAARSDLGERYRHILVDEFQDTDPLQAEMLFLLASPPDADDIDEPDWRLAVPRPGALFVVGDPKQSIYRFRRADITIYNQVKRRFEEFGGVVRLTANFRSGPPIEQLVDAVFGDRFPAQATEMQAAFAPLQVQQKADPLQAVHWYRVVSPGRKPREMELNEIDARRVASLIEERLRAGGRPGDYLILTRKKKFLTAYAREFEARNLPVQVTGGGVGIEEELSELRLLLAALADPGDATLTVAVLVGLFFGLDYEQLAAHVLDRNGKLEFTATIAMPGTDVETALAKLHEYWVLARTEPADVVVARLVYELGLLPYAAAGDLGESRAGALLFVLEAVRAAALRGDASLAGAITAIDASLDAAEAEAPLEPGRDDVIRVMNLHQAKGLEAEIVILASPFGEWDHAPMMHVTREESGSALGWIVVAERRWRMNDTVLARPLDWPDHEAVERAFQAAENDRLLYVAATRARRELIIGRFEIDTDSPWGAFHPYLESYFAPIEIVMQEPPGRARLQMTADEITGLVAATDAKRLTLARPRYHAAAVRNRVKTPLAILPETGSDRGTARIDEAAGFAAVAGPSIDATPGQPRADPWTLPDAEPIDTAVADDGAAGMEWGKLVHAALEEAGRGRSGQSVRSFCRARMAASEDAPQDGRNEERLDALMRVVDGVIASPVWKRALGSDLMLVEAPFSLSIDYASYAMMKPAGATGAAPVQVIDGVIDLVFREAAGWTIVDYKSDRAGSDIDDAVRAMYRAQVSMYADCWTRLTGEPVHERIILFTADGSTDAW